MSQVAVMHITDTLDGGGMERVAVNISNLLPRQRYRAYLCTTRRDGVFEKLLFPHVGRLRLNRQRRFDVRALIRLVVFIRANDIQLLHAHDNSFFIASLASLFSPHPAVIWHDHWGLYPVKERPGSWLFRLLKSRVRGVLAVNRSLAGWSQRRLNLPASKIWYMPNFVSEASHSRGGSKLPGDAGYRIVCVANLRAQKDHLNLIHAMALVVKQEPRSHLLLVGPPSDSTYFTLISEEIAQQGLAQHITFLGQRLDVVAILDECDIGVLSSAAEGLPLALIEYGMAGLPVVSTQVGQCAEVLDEGKAGLLVPPSAADSLADALLLLLRCRERRTLYGERLRCRVREYYSADSIMKQICEVYDLILSEGNK